MPASIGVNLRVTGHCSQGGRKYMEDLFSVAYQQTEDERDLEYAFFGIYDGHGGSEAAAFAKEHLMDSIVKQRQFWSDNDEDILKAIRNGYMLTHLNMWKELEKWPKTVTGLPSTAGTTASVAFIRRGKIYIGHVGDSAIILGYQKEGCDDWVAKPLTSDHKPESSCEMERIERCGGKVVSKAGVPRVVWNRPRPGHKGPIKKTTPMDEIPFLAVARSLGDLWSYNAQNDEFIVSPDPDVGVLTIDPTKFRCLIFGTDGLWNMISAEGAVRLVQATERHNEAALVAGGGAQPRDWLNPSKSLVDHALERWSNTRMRADNTSVVTLMLDPPGPPRATVLRSRGTAQRPPAPLSPTPSATATATAAAAAAPVPPAPLEPQPEAPTETDARHVPQNGLTIVTRYSDVDRGAPSPSPSPSPDAAPPPPLPPCATLDGRFSLGAADESPSDADRAARSDTFCNYGNPTESSFMARLLNRTRVLNTLCAVYDEIVKAPPTAESPPLTSLDDHHAEPTPSPKDPVDDDDAETNSSTKIDDVEVEATAASPAAAAAAVAEDAPEDGGIQINEVSSSSPTDCPPKPRSRRSKLDPGREPTPPAANGRVLRSHDADTAHRPQTRRATGAGRTRPPEAPAPALERVVILNRARGVPVPPAVLRISTAPGNGDGRPAPRRAAPEPVTAPEGGRGKQSGGPATRSKDTSALPFAQKITRSISNVARELRGQPPTGAAGAQVARQGNSQRAPGPARRTAPTARREPGDPLEGQTECSKENFGAVRRRRGGARARERPAHAPAPHAPHAPPPPPPPRPFTRLLHSGADSPARPPRHSRRPPADEDAAEVHSTTGDHVPMPLLCIVEPKAVSVLGTRALRSRNEVGPQSPAVARREPAGAKRPGARDERSPASKAAKLMAAGGAAGERCTRALGKRASGPWAPALALRNRLRKRLAK